MSDVGACKINDDFFQSAVALSAPDYQSIANLIKTQEGSARIYLRNSTAAPIEGTKELLLAFSLTQTSEQKLGFFHHIVEVDEAGNPTATSTIMFGKPTAQDFLDGLGLTREDVQVDEFGDFYVTVNYEQLGLKLPAVNAKAVSKAVGLSEVPEITADNSWVVTMEKGNNEENPDYIICMSTTAGIKKDQLEALTSDRQNVGILSIDLRNIALSFNIEPALEQLRGLLQKDHALDPLSVLALMYEVERAMPTVVVDLIQKLTCETKVEEEATA